MKYTEEQAGVWITPKRKYYNIMCCDCGLVHKMEFRLRKTTSGNQIEIRFWRDERATGAARRKGK